MINVTVNGEEREVSEKITLAELIQILELPSERVAVELNREVVRRANWQNTQLNENDQIEIVHFVGGGAF
jgi:thiamine biosynthesis protein ThiS